MEVATLTRSRPGSSDDVPTEATPRRRPSVPALALVLLAAATVVGALIYPTYPNYDSTYSLLWGRELLDGTRLSFEAYRTPTQHPLAIVFGAVLSLFGDGADRLMVLATLASFVALAAGLYALARHAFGPWVGLVAAALLVSRFDFPFLAARAYIDIPYLACVVWAATLEARQRRRGGPVFALLICAGLLRPEAWLIVGLYFLWMVLPRPFADLRRTLAYAVLTASAPVIWALTDFAVTGDPLFSLTHTSSLAEELGRQRELSDLPSATIQFLKNLDKAPVFYAGVLGLGIAAWLTPRRLGMPATLLAIGLGTFGLVGLAGLSVIDRYLLVPSLMVMVFAAVAVAGWTMLRPGRLRTAWTVLSALLVLYGGVFTATRVNFHEFDVNLQFRGASHDALEDVLRSDAVRAARAQGCGPISVPTHKLIPDVRWILDLGEDDVLARSDPLADARTARGLAVYTTSRAALLRNALVEAFDDPLDNVPAPGFTRLATSPHYAVYANC